MRFVIKGVEYDAADVRRVSLARIIAFDRESVREGYGILWAEVEDRMNAYMRLDIAEKKSHPDTFLLLGLSIWATRTLAGEKVTFAEAIDVDISPESGDFQIVLDPDEVQQPPDPRPARSGPKGSGRATSKASAKKAKRKASTSARANSAKTSKAKSTSV